MTFGPSGFTHVLLLLHLVKKSLQDEDNDQKDDDAHNNPDKPSGNLKTE